MTTRLVPSDPTLAKRLEAAMHALDAYADAKRSQSEPDQEKLTDLFTDLRHVCQARGISFVDAMISSHGRYAAETGAPSDEETKAATMAELAREQQIFDIAKERFEREGDLEFDNPCVSEGDENGAYVQCWKWLDFSGTDFDKK